jgi:hypothetical protein
MHCLSVLCARMPRTPSGNICDEIEAAGSEPRSIRKFGDTENAIRAPENRQIDDVGRIVRRTPGRQIRTHQLWTATKRNKATPSQGPRAQPFRDAV